MSDKLTELLGEDAIEEGMNSPEVVEGRMATAEAAAEYWRSVSPTGGVGDPHRGRYKDTVGVVVEGEHVKVGSSDEIANLVEYGSIHNDAHAPRARTEEHFNSGGGGV